MIQPHPTVVLTREPPDNDVLAAVLHAQGVDIRECPCIETALIPLNEDQVALLDKVDVVAFTSRRGVQGVANLGSRLSDWKGAVAAVGPGTARAVQEILGRPVDLVPEEANAGALAEAMIQRFEEQPAVSRPHLSRPQHILHVRGTITRGTLGERLSQAGHIVSEWTVYQTCIRTVEPLTEPRRSIIVLASPSAVDGFLTGNRADDPRFRYVAIGSQTGRRLAERGIQGYRQADRATPDGLLNAVRMMLGSEQERE